MLMILNKFDVLTREGSVSIDFGFQSAALSGYPGLFTLFSESREVLTESREVAAVEDPAALDATIEYVVALDEITGVPEMSPVVESNEMPTGSAGLIE